MINKKINYFKRPMGEILFRGKLPYSGNWIHGGLVERDGETYIVGILNSLRIDGVEVIPETMGQFTGMTDENGVKIFEGDVVEGLFFFGMSINAVVTFKGGSFGLKWYREGIEEFSAFSSFCNVTFKVIGNIFDNPELMKGGAKWVD